MWVRVLVLRRPIRLTIFAGSPGTRRRIELFREDVGVTIKLLLNAVSVPHAPATRRLGDTYWYPGCWL